MFRARHAPKVVVIQAQHDSLVPNQAAGPTPQCGVRGVPTVAKGTGNCTNSSCRVLIQFGACVQTSLSQESQRTCHVGRQAQVSEDVHTAKVAQVCGSEPLITQLMTAWPAPHTRPCSIEHTAIRDIHTAWACWLLAAQQHTFSSSALLLKMPSPWGPKTTQHIPLTTNSHSLPLSPLPPCL